MPKRKNKGSATQERKLRGIEKCPPGIHGLDEITYGGLPCGRPTLIAGGAGSGKTLPAMEFLIHGALDYGEPGMFMAFEETTQDLIQNVASLGYDLARMIRRGQSDIDHVRVERSEIEETGEYDLEGLFVRLNSSMHGTNEHPTMIDEHGLRVLPITSLEAAEKARQAAMGREREAMAHLRSADAPSAGRHR